MQENSVEILAPLALKCFSRGEGGYLEILKDAWKLLAFKARMGDIKFFYLHNSGGRIARMINECWHKMVDGLNSVGLVDVGG